MSHCGHGPLVFFGEKNKFQAKMFDLSGTMNQTNQKHMTVIYCSVVGIDHIALCFKKDRQVQRILYVPKKKKKGLDQLIKSQK